MNGVLAAERAQVASACVRLAAAGLFIGTAGNVSVRGAGEHAELVAVTATGAVLADITADEVSVVTLDGAHVAGDFAATSELELHLGVYRRFGSGAAVHTHAPKSTAAACVLDELPVIHYQQLLLGGATPVIEFHAFGTHDLAEAVLRGLAGKQAALLANHGSVAHGPTLGAAIEHALLLEWACGLYLDASRLGTPRALTEQQQLAVVQAALKRGYGRTKPSAGSQPKGIGLLRDRHGRARA
ncbi:MAG: class II aldolase/adducin family protein [Mycobacteriaceae bacterium]|nr:class II aldolase/adducin family protein [Mycobacteriaceae bacterium]